MKTLLKVAVNVVVFIAVNKAAQVTSKAIIGIAARRALKKQQKENIVK